MLKRTSIWAAPLLNANLTMYANYIKRTLDFIAAFLLLLVLSPVFFTLMLACAFAFKGRMFFAQPRVGQHERTFTMYKFISMTPKSEVPEADNSDTTRLTTFGRLIRRTSLDELPQLINILRGQMSFVGPRPLLVDYLPYYRTDERVRHLMRPGITGLAQVNGRNALSWDARFSYDVQYVNKASFLLDLKILIRTLVQILRGKDIVADPRSEMLDLSIERQHEILPIE